MNNILSDKIIVGSALKAINKAKVYGTLDLNDLYFFIIFNNLYKSCFLVDDFENKNKIKNLLIFLQNYSDSICNYRKTNVTTNFIKAQNDLKLNHTYNTNFNNIVETGNFTSIFDNEIYTFSTDDFTTNLTLDPNKTYALKVTSIPLVGLLTLNNVNVIQGQQISFLDIENDNFKYIPNDIDLDYSISFNFQIIEL